VQRNALWGCLQRQTVTRQIGGGIEVWEVDAEIAGSNSHRRIGRLLPMPIDAAPCKSANRRFVQAGRVPDVAMGRDAAKLSRTALVV
jgi:hypothetical protein